MYSIKKADGSEAIIMGPKPGFKRLKQSPLISTETVKPQPKAGRRVKPEPVAPADVDNKGAKNESAK